MATTRGTNSQGEVVTTVGGAGRIKFVVEKATLDDDINNMASSGAGPSSASAAAAAAATDPSNNNNETSNNDVRIPLNASGSKSFDFYEGQQEKHVGTFLSSILNFNSLIPSSKEISAQQQQQQQANKLGTVLGVFLPCVQNIFGVILFIRASWVVGVAGTFQAFLIVLMCCSCTLLTAISTSAIATNGIVPAGGPYFMISRSLGPECGGAVGILFYLGNTVAASMYIVGAVEIFLKYMCPEATLIGNIEIQSDAFHNFRIYGTLFLIIIGCIVCIGIKFVSKLAPMSLIAVLISVLAIYAGVVKSAFSPPDLKICVFNQTRLLRYESYKVEGVTFCTNDRYCTLTATNQTIDCPLWIQYCGKVYEKEFDNVTQRDVYGSERRRFDDQEKSSQQQQQVSGLDREQFEYFENLCDYFERANSIESRLGIPGLADGRPLRENFDPHYMDEGEVEPGVRGVPDLEILGKEYTSFLVLIGIYFPSVTGIMAGSNRSGDLKDPSRSIPRGTIAAVLTTSFIYLSNVLFFGASIDGLLLRDKFGDSIDKELVVGVLSWPNKWVIMVGAFLSTFGAGMQSLTSAPRILQAVSKDEIIPFLKPFAKTSSRGEPFYALLATLFLCECGILLGNVDYLTPLIAMFFLLCYGFINMACALQTLLKAPSWRPRYRYYHWTLSLLGLFLCLLIMFIVKWYYAIVAIFLAACIYKYIEFKGAEKEWGDGLRGLSMSAARYALLKLEEEPPHVKNWRPQLLVLAKCKEGEKGSGIFQLDSLRQQMSEPEDLSPATSPIKSDQSNNNNIVLEHPHIFAFGSQIKAGKGLFMCASVIHGNYLTDSQFAKDCKQAIKRTMHEYKAKGFCDCLVAEHVEQGLSHVIQSAGLGGLRPNTIVLNWPDKWYKDSIERGDDEDDHQQSLSLSGFVQTLRYINENGQAILITKGIDNWPVSAKNDSQSDRNIDVWWIMHDGGLLLLIVFLLKKNKIWHKCRLRLFTIAQEDEDSVKIKKDLEQYMYYLRIDAEVEVVELAHAEVSAYAYEKTLRLHEREKLLREMKLKESNIDNEPQIMMDRVRRNSVIKGSSTTSGNDEQKLPTSSASETETATNSFKNQFTFSASHYHNHSNARRPSVLKTDTIKKMHSAVELNKRILEKSKESALVLMNIPPPPKTSGITDYNYMTYINTATEGLNRVLMVKGSGREVITIFS